MANKKRKGRRGKDDRLNYVIVGPKGAVTVVSGKTGKTTTLSKSKADKVLDLVRARQQLGTDITSLLQELGVVVNPKGTIHLEEGEFQEGG